MNRSLFFIIVAVFVFILPQQASASWYDMTWGYRKSHVVNGAAGAGTNYQVMITTYYGSGTDSAGSVYLSSHSKTDFGDIRFTASDGITLLNYWMASKVDSNNAVFWVKIPDNISASPSTIYIYYGMASATTTSNGANTFLFFDDFSGDLSKWTVESSSGVYPRIESGYMRAGGGTTGGGYGFTSLGSSPTYSTFADAAVGGKVYNSLDAIGEVAFRGVAAGNTGYKGRSDARAGQGQSFQAPPYSSWNFLPGGGCGADGVAPPINTWGTFEIQTTGTTFRYYRDGTLQRTCTDVTYAGPGEIALQNHYGSYTDYDDIYVRKFVSPEPGHGAWGIEELPSRRKILYY